MNTEYNNFYTNQSNNIKKTNKSKIIAIITLGIVTIIAIMFILSLIEDSKKTIYQSGEVEIFNKIIQLPCDLEDFKNILNAELVSSSKEGFINVKMNDLELVFEAYIQNDMITGIIIKETDDSYLTTRTKFPGNISIYTSLNEVNKIYKTSPFNINYKTGGESFGYEEYHRYRNDEWEIIIYASEDEIKEIQYFYLGYDD